MGQCQRGEGSQWEGAGIGKTGAGAGGGSWEGEGERKEGFTGSKLLFRHSSPSTEGIHHPRAAPRAAALLRSNKCGHVNVGNKGWCFDMLRTQTSSPSKASFTWP